MTDICIIDYSLVLIFLKQQRDSLRSFNQKMGFPSRLHSVHQWALWGILTTVIIAQWNNIDKLAISPYLDFPTDFMGCKSWFGIKPFPFSVFEKLMKH